MNRDLRAKRLIMALAIGTAAWPFAAMAGESAEPAAADAQQRSTTAGIADIVVTAQRRAENLQSVPIAITAIDGVQMEKQGIKTVDDVQIATPALTITRVLQAPLFYLRGVGTASSQPQEEPSIPLYIDGFYASAGAGSIMSLTNIERMEVLRGPQGTLFGRNGTGGLINIVTRQPSHEPGGTLEIGYGNYGTVDGKLYATAGLTENIAADVAVYYTKRHEGFGRNVVLGTDVGLNREFAIRSKLLIEPTDRTTITLAGEYSNVRTDFGFTSQLAPGVLGVDGVTRRTRRQNVSANTIQYTTPKTFAFSGRIDQDIGFGTLVSMTQYRSNRTYWQKDVESLPINFANAFQTEYVRYFTQEIQLQSPADSALQWVAGAFYFSGGGGIDPLILTGDSLTTAYRSRSIYSNVATESFAGFAQATYEIFDRTKLTLGGRYTHDKKRLTGGASLELPSGETIEVLSGIDQKISTGRFTYRAALDHQLNDDILLYAIISRGYKAGSFNAQSPSDPAIRPETLDAIEGGIKSDFFDRRLRVNLAGYHYNYKDIQLTQLVPVGTGGSLSRMLNATSAKISGFELEVVAQPVSQLTISGSLAYTHGRYGTFENAPRTERAPFDCDGNPTRPLASRNAQCVGDATGHKTARTPPITSTVSVNYDLPLGDKLLSLSGSWYHNGGFYFEPDNRVKQRAYNLVNADARLTFNDSFAIRGWVRNLFQKEYLAGISVSNQDLFVPAAPRTYGMSLIVTF